MAKQVKPFEGAISIGLMVWCCYDDGFREPEGTVYFDSMPTYGDTAVLCDGKTWEVCGKVTDEMEVNMRRKE